MFPSSIFSSTLDSNSSLNEQPQGSGQLTHNQSNPAWENRSIQNLKDLAAFSLAGGVMFASAVVLPSWLAGIAFAFSGSTIGFYSLFRVTKLADREVQPAPPQPQPRAQQPLNMADPTVSTQQPPDSSEKLVTQQPKADIEHRPDEHLKQNKELNFALQGAAAQQEMTKLKSQPVVAQTKNLQGKHGENKQLKKQSEVSMNRLVAISTRQKHNVNEGHKDSKQSKSGNVTGKVQHLNETMPSRTMPSRPMPSRPMPSRTKPSRTKPSLSDDAPSDHSSLEQPQNPQGKFIAGKKGTKKDIKKVTKKITKKGITWVTEASSKVADKTAIDNGPLGQCIQFLKDEPFAKNDTKDSRSSCTQLFDSFEGLQLFTVGYHWQAPGGTPKYKDMLKYLKKNSSGTMSFGYNANDPDYHKTLEIDANQVPVDRESTLRFINLFTKAIAQERKERGKETSAQLDKKQERLQALGEIREFVTKLAPNAPDAAALCRLALQLCGRCRERSLVRQKSLGLCGAFSALQAAWGKAPLKMTRLALKLACYYKASSELNKVNFELPEGINFSHYDSALADSLLLSAFYKFNNGYGTTSNENMLFSRALGIAVQIFDHKQNPSDSTFINELVQATKSKAAVSLGLDNKLTTFLCKSWIKNWSRKYNEKPWDIDEGFKSFHSSDRINHAVIMDSCHINSKGNIEVKIQSWGRVMRLEMEQQTFLKHIIKESTLIFPAGNEGPGSKGVFKNPDDRIVYIQETNKENKKLEFINTCDGTRIVFDDIKGSKYLHVDPKIVYQNKQGKFVVFDTDSGKKKIYDASAKKIIFENKKKGALELFQTSDFSISTLNNYNCGWYQDFGSELIYQNKEGDFQVYKPDVNSISTFLNCDQYIFHNKKEGALVLIDRTNKKTKIFRDSAGEWFHIDPDNRVLIYKNKKGEFITFDMDCEQEIPHKILGEKIFYQKEKSVIFYNTSSDVNSTYKDCEGDWYHDSDSELIYKIKNGPFAVFRAGNDKTDCRITTDQKLFYFNEKNKLVIFDIRNGEKIILDDYYPGNNGINNYQFTSDRSKVKYGISNEESVIYDIKSNTKTIG